MTAVDDYSPCSECGGYGFIGFGTGYGDVCAHCGGTQVEPRAPTTPLPWHGHPYQGDIDAAYAIHAANAFPHLVAALEVLARDWPDSSLTAIEHALAIARGETSP